MEGRDRPQDSTAELDIIRRAAAGGMGISGREAKELAKRLEAVELTLEEAIHILNQIPKTSIYHSHFDDTYQFISAAKKIVKK